jgi:hypothetical protein
MTQRTSGGRTNALDRELRTQVDVGCRASAEGVFALLQDLRSHAVWGGERQKAKTRIASIEAPDGPAGVGTEFSSTGIDPMGRFADRSVVTEAQAPNVFEFVTEATLTTKKGAVSEWTVVHRYELERAEPGCRIRSTIRVTRISAMTGMLVAFKIPGPRSLALRASAGVDRRGVRNLARLAEERSTPS